MTLIAVDELLSIFDMIFDRVVRRCNVDGSSTPVLNQRLYTLETLFIPPARPPVPSEVQSPTEA